MTLLELTNAYGVFANDGIYNTPTGILEVYDREGNVLEKYTKKEKDVIPKEFTDKLSNVLSDPYSRSLTFSPSNPINFYDRQVAAKTGTTNDFKDVWVIGYTPSLVVGMWGGNNDNKPVTRVAGTVLSPVWRKFMDYALKDTPKEYFDTPVSSATSSPAFIRGVYCSGANISTILQYVGGAGSVGGYSDSQYNLWNTPIQNWAQNNACPFGQIQNVPENSDAGIDEAIIPETNVAQ
jgi:membrane peptidoglycan carboxypeptidase